MAATGSPTLAAAASGAVSGAMNGVFEELNFAQDCNVDFSWGRAGKNALIGGAKGAVTGAISGAIGSAASNFVEPLKFCGKSAGQIAKDIAKHWAVDFVSEGVTGTVTTYAMARMDGQSVQDAIQTTKDSSGQIWRQSAISATVNTLSDAAAAPHCFIAGTSVLTVGGLIAIENIQAGDMVIATDPETGETAEKEVLEVYVNESDELIHLTVDEEEITTTPVHPFYVSEQGWTAASELEEGDILITADGDYATVNSVEYESLDEPVTVYNFQVADFHSYYVGENCVLVHNAGDGGRCDGVDNVEPKKPAENVDPPETVVNQKGQTIKQDDSGNWHDTATGQFAEGPDGPKTDSSDHYLHRPYLRKNVIDQINENTLIDEETGQLYDMISDKWVDKNDVQLGHKTGAEFSLLRDIAESEGMSQKQFNDFMNDPEFYAWQGTTENLSHKFEEQH